MTTNELTDTIVSSMFKRGFYAYCTNFTGDWYCETDVIGINNNQYVFEYEVKRSMADFQGEFRNKKDKHLRLSGEQLEDEYRHGIRIKNKIKIPNRYYFACEKDLIPIEKIPKYAGLFYISRFEWAENCFNYIYDIVKRAPLLHKEKADDMLWRAIANTLSQRMVTGSSYIYHRNKVMKNLHQCTV